MGEVVRGRTNNDHIRSPRCPLSLERKTCGDGPVFVLPRRPSAAPCGRGADQRGDERRLGLPSGILEDAKREVFNGVDIRRVPVNKRRGSVLGYLYQYSAFLLMSSWIIAVRSLSRRYDLVYVNNMPDFLVLSGLFPKLFGAKVLLDIHDPMPELMMTIFELPKDARTVDLLKFQEKWSIRLADSVVTVDRACARIFASRSCASKKITVVMNSPDENIFQFRDAASQQHSTRKQTICGVSCITGHWSNETGWNLP